MKSENGGNWGNWGNRGNGEMREVGEIYCPPPEGVGGGVFARVGL